MTRRAWTWLTVLAASAGLVAVPASAQPQTATPAGPITLVVGYPAGGTADTGARILAEKLTLLLGQPVLVENKPGAGGQLAARQVKAARVDGSVLFFTNGHTVVTVPLTVKSPGFDTEVDFTPVAPVANFELALVAHPSTMATTLAELMAYYERMPDRRDIAVPAPASAPEFVVGRLAQLLKANVQAVPYRGALPAVQDVLGAQVPAAVVPVGDVLQHVRAGKLTALAVTHPSAQLPGVPGFAQLKLPELAVTDFLGVYGPPGLSATTVQRYNTAIRQVLAMPDVIAKLEGFSLQPDPGMPARLAERFQQSRNQVRGLVKAVNFQPQ